MSEFIPPEYRRHDLKTVGTIYECLRCGSIILFREAHTKWHSDLSVVVGSLMALSRVLVPDMPDGQLLSEVREDILRNASTEDLT